MSLWERIARESVGEDYAERYAARFRALAARGEDVHGEATFVTGLLPPPDLGLETARVAPRWREGLRRGSSTSSADARTEQARPERPRILDAGCGTGRIAVRLVELGYDVVGVDVDASMLAQARRDVPDLDWREGDLASLDLDEEFDLVLVAGNTMPLLEPGTVAAAYVRLAGHLRSEGMLVTGFGLDAGHLPSGCPVLPLDQADEAAEDAGLELVERWSTWDRAPHYAGEGYVVTVHQHAG